MFRKLEKNFDGINFFYDTNQVTINTANTTLEKGIDRDKKQKSINRINNPIESLSYIPRLFSAPQFFEVSGQFYFRSDTRSPSEILKNGFSPRTKMGDFWWTEAIKSRGFINDRGIDNRATDGDPGVCTCMTTNFNSAPLFPLKKGDTYIYVIALPESTKIRYVYNKTLVNEENNVKFDRKLPTPMNIKDIVFDLHDFQITQTNNIYAYFSKQNINDPSIVTYAGWPLYAYEAISYKVYPSAIVCAVACKREPLENLEISCSTISSKPVKSLNMKFTLFGEVIENENFSPTKIYAIQDNQSAIIDFSLKKVKMIQKINDKINTTFTTPNIYSGL